LSGCDEPVMKSAGRRRSCIPRRKFSAWAPPKKEVAARAAWIGRDPDELRANGLAGTVDEVRAKIQTFADAGATRLYLQVLNLSDLDHLRLVAEEVA
jgi:alkanesulfonate monooxygenase SsuD/methylene tetrahydromethanopterin reductase-like flavin-dependent oxidoreductase (luciferase family)